jgi:plastocyanin
LKVALALAALIVCAAMLPMRASASVASSFAIDISKPVLASDSTPITDIVVGERGIVVVATGRNNMDHPVNATFAIQVTDQYGFTEALQFQKGAVVAHGDTEFGVKWVPQMPGKFVIDAFAVDNLDSPHTLSDKSSSLVQVEKGRAFVRIPHGAVNFSPVIAVVIMGYNNTVTWLNEDDSWHEIAADKDNSDFAAAAGDAGVIPPNGTLTYTFTKPGRYGYHGNGLHGTVLVLPDPYEGFEKVRDSRITSMDLVVYGSYDPTLAGHFVKGHIYDGNGGPLANGTVSISANGVFMGNVTSDVDGCFDFQSLKAEPFSHQKEVVLQEGRSLMDLGVSAWYGGDSGHFWSSATRQSIMYLSWPPVAPASYETSVYSSSYNNSTGAIDVKQGARLEIRLNVKPVLKEYDTERMTLELQRLPCGVSATMPSPDRVTMDHPGTFQFAMDVRDYAAPGKYFVLARQHSPAGNLYARDPDVAGFWLEILPK